MKKTPDMKTGIEDVWVTHGNQRLRCGYTTGTCAAAAARGAAAILLGVSDRLQTEIMIPKGILLTLPLEEVRSFTAGNSPAVQAGVRKDAGDDPDMTDGILVCALVQMKKEPGISIKGGKGVGRVTLPGLPVPPGEPAINPVPRRMITQAVEEILERSEYEGGLTVEIFVPEGEAAAKKTFNERIGIQGGISILGTTGIVVPMSEKALLDSIRIEMKQRLAMGERILPVSPGNYGEDFIRKNTGQNTIRTLRCSNYVGEIIDMAAELGAEGILFVAHIGKFVKVAGGIMNTHSHQADCRMEILTAAALQCGADGDQARRILAAATTEDALARLTEMGMTSRVMERIMEKIRYYLEHHSYGKLRPGAIVYSFELGVLGQTDNAPDLLRQILEHGKGQESLSYSGKAGQETGKKHGSLAALP